MFPGFNAEASVYRTMGWPGAAGRPQSPEIKGASVIPQFLSSCWRICRGNPDCVQCCICVRRGGHPSQCCS
jgi:hypothetical protein